MSKRQRVRPAAPRPIDTPRVKPAVAEPAVAEPVPTAHVWDHAFLLLLVMIPVMLTAIGLLPELTLRVPISNDLAFHWQMVQAASNALAHGRNPLDIWMPQLELGYPQFLYYQNLPHLFVALVHRALFGLVELRTLFNGTRYILMVALPLTVYWSMRRMEFSVRSAAISAAATSLFAARDGFGLEFDGHVWIGRGLYTQLWAEHLAFIAIACLHRLLRTGRGFVATVLVLAALGLTHFIWSYMLAMASVLLWLLMSERRMLLPNAIRLGSAGLLSIAVASYMLVPFVADGRKYVASTLGVTLPDILVQSPLMTTLSGALMDEGRWPVLTVLAGVGILAALHRRTPNARLAFIGSLVWLVLYQVRPAGVTFLGTAFRYDGHLIFRFVGIMEVFALLLIGLGGESIWSLITDRLWPWLSSKVGVTRAPIGSALACAVLLALLSPALLDRSAFYGLNGRSIARTERVLESDTDLRAVLDTLDQRPGGRVYAGLNRNWGKQVTVGPLLKVYDVLKSRGRPSVAPAYHGLSLNTDMVVGFRDGDPAMYDILDVRYVVAPATAQPPAFLQPFFFTKRYILYRMQTTGMAMYGSIADRRSVGSQVDLVEGNDAWSKSNGPATRRFIRWDYMAPAGPRTLSAGCPDGGHTVNERVEAGLIDLVVECAAAATLVLKTTYHPNWHVTVDGQRVPTFMVSPSYIAFALPAGRHQVVARYEMAAAKMYLLAFGLSVLAFVAVFGTRLSTFPNSEGRHSGPSPLS